MLGTLEARSDERFMWPCSMFSWQSYVSSGRYHAGPDRKWRHNQSIKVSSWQLSWHSQCNVDESDLHSHLPCSKEVMMVLFDLLWTNPKNVKQATMKCLREDNKILFCQFMSLWVSIVTPPSFGTYFLKKKYWKLFVLIMTDNDLATSERVGFKSILWHMKQSKSKIANYTKGKSV